MTSALDILTPLCAVIDLNRLGPCNWMCGVYLLIANDEIVYVGQSVDVQSRVRAHLRRARSEPWFDRALWMHIAPEHLNAFEGALIEKLRPKYSASHARKARTFTREQALAAMGFTS